MKRLVKRIKKARGVAVDDVAIPVAATQPGEFAQVDFGHVGKLFDPHEKRMREAYVFVMVLFAQPRMVTRLVFDQKVATWLRLHVEAFVVSQPTISSRLSGPPTAEEQAWARAVLGL